jgi:hypothetical protein
MRNAITRKACRFISTIALLTYFSDIQAVLYPFSNEPIDAVIPAIDKDLSTLEFCIEGIKTNCPEVRRIIVISPKRLTNSAEWFDEKNFPFDKAKVTALLTKEKQSNLTGLLKSRSGWYLQQLLKFYASYVVPGLSSNVLFVDADTIFLRKVTFINEEGGGLFSLAKEHHAPYFQHAAKLIPGFIKVSKDSGIAHHMLFQKPILDHLFSLVESTHGCPFWQAFCSMVNSRYGFAGASEYEIYFNFALSQTDQVKRRPLKWENLSSLKDISKYKNLEYDYVSCHTWMRKK